MGIESIVKSMLGIGNDPAPIDYTASLEAIANASREAQVAQSNGMLAAAQSQSATMQLGILKSSQDAQLQTQAWLTERLDTTSAKLQMAEIAAKSTFTAESDHHVERMEQLRIEQRRHERIVSGGAASPDIPEPNFS